MAGGGGNGSFTYALAVDGTVVAALIRDQLRPEREGIRKVSLRAATPAVDVSLIARKENGGGHRQAAGFSTRRSDEELIEFLKNAFDAQDYQLGRKPDGKVWHADLTIAGAHIMISEATGPFEALGAAVNVYVPDVDETYRRALDAGLRHRLESARAVQRNVQVSVLGAGVSGGEAVDRLDTAGQQYLGQMPSSLQSLVVGRGVQVSSPRFIVTDAPDRTYQNTLVNLRYQDGLDGVIELVAGRMPGAHGVRLPPIDYGFIPEDWAPPEVLPRFDIALSDATAEAAGLHLGDIIGVTADGTDPMLDRAFAVPLPAELEVVGIYRVLDPDAERVILYTPPDRVRVLGRLETAKLRFFAFTGSSESKHPVVIRILESAKQRLAA